jgi:hypothetical protein
MALRLDIYSIVHRHLVASHESKPPGQQHPEGATFTSKRQVAMSTASDSLDLHVCAVRHPENCTNNPDMMCRGEQFVLFR